jgi:hypothetical protein
MAKKPLPRLIEPMMASVVIALVSEHAVKRTDAHVSRQPELYTKTSMPEVSLPFTEVRTSRSILSSY